MSLQPGALLGPYEILSPIGAGAHQVTADGGDAENPTSPRTGGWIYYDSSHPQKDGLWRVHADGSAASIVIRGETAHPAVSADGDYVLFHRPEPDGGTWMLVVMRIADGATFELAHLLRRNARSSTSTACGVRRPCRRDAEAWPRLHERRHGRRTPVRCTS